MKQWAKRLVINLCVIALLACAGYIIYFTTVKTTEVSCCLQVLTYIPSAEPFITLVMQPVKDYNMHPTMMGDYIVKVVTLEFLCMSAV